MKVIETRDTIDFLDERFYVVDEEKQIFYPSVTHVLSVIDKGFGFNQWLQDVGANAKFIAERAAESGTKIHNAIETLISGEEIQWDDKAYNLEEWLGILKFKEFYETFKPEILACEARVISNKFKYAGRIDIVCKLQGFVWIIDIKTGNGLYDSHDLQIASYRSAWNEQSDIKADKQGILWLKALTRGPVKDKIQGKGWQLKEPKRPYEDLFKVFKSALDIYYFQNPNAMPKNIQYPKIVKL